jgi:hypothetical protein
MRNMTKSMPQASDSEMMKPKILKTEGEGALHS